MPENDFLADDALAEVARAVAHPARISILRLLSRQSECTGAEVFSELPLAQSTVSEHVRVLKDAGLVKATPDGTRMVYCLVPEAFGPLLRLLAAFSSAAPACSPSNQSQEEEADE